MESLMLAPLSTQPSRWKSLFTGWGIQIVIVGFVLALNTLFPAAIPQAKKFVYTSLIAPEPVIRASQPINPHLQVKVRPTPIPVETPVVAKLIVSPQVRKTREPEIKAPEIQLSTALPKLPNAPQAQIVATNTFATPTDAMPTTTKPAAQVQTGGFGDPNGIPATGSSHGNIAVKGNPGFGNGSGGAKGTPGVGIVGNGTVQASGFDRQAAMPVKIAALNESAIPVEIISKPKPLYTEEGRKRGIEGEVRLEVEFRADGRVDVIRVLQGLGFGLDEQALRCAEQITFKPAQHGGRAIDSTAVVHIVFELAS